MLEALQPRIGIELSAQVRESAPPARVFTPWAERYNVGIFFLFVPLVILHQLGYLGFVSHLSMRSQDLIRNVIFLNALHITFTYLQILMIPELRQWTVDVSGGKSAYRFWLYTGAWVLGLSVLFGASGFLTKSIHGPLRDGVSWLMMTWPIYHSVWQIRGISLQYSHRLRSDRTLSPAEVSLFQRVDRSERILFWVFVLGAWMNNLFQCDMLGDYLGGPREHTGGVICIWVMAVTLLLLVLNTLRLSMPGKRQKAMYLCRLAVYPLFYIDTFAAICEGMIHGTEYALVTNKMETNSVIHSRKAARRRFYLVLAIGLLLYGFYNVELNYHLFPLGGTYFGINSLRWRLAVGGYYGVNIAHYYVDAKLFKMSNPANRKWVGRLLA